jgi:hypothetical protein
MAFAMTAPVAPATARPHGGINASFDCPAIAATDEGDVGFAAVGVRLAMCRVRTAW